MIKPLHEQVPLPTIANWGGGNIWKKFTEKVVLWIFLCQNFSFRMSVFIQVLLDMEKKKKFNCVSTHTTKEADGAFLFCNLDKKTDFDRREKGPPDLENMTIFDFYMNHVVEVVEQLKGKEIKASKVDKDDKEFILLMMNTYTESPITCADILGPRFSSYRVYIPGWLDRDERNKSFSLLAYSLNLDPAMRIEVIREYFILIWCFSLEC